MLSNWVNGETFWKNTKFANILLIFSFFDFTAKSISTKQNIDLQKVEERSRTWTPGFEGDGEGKRWVYQQNWISNAFIVSLRERDPVCAISSRGAESEGPYSCPHPWETPGLEGDGEGQWGVVVHQQNKLSSAFIVSPRKRDPVCAISSSGSEAEGP